MTSAERCSLSNNVKYCAMDGSDCLLWIKNVTRETFSTAGDIENFYQVLRDGVILCKLVNTLHPGSVRKINYAKKPFKCMENISSFKASIVSMGVAVQDTFETSDLWDKRNLCAVVMCIMSLKRLANSMELIPQHFPAEPIEIEMDRETETDIMLPDDFEEDFHI